MYKTTKDLKWFTEVNGLPVIRRPVTAKGGTWAKGHPVGIVFHYTAGCGSDLSSVFQERRVSAHFSVDRDGNIYQYVPVAEVAWHADRANGFYVGIEHSALPGTCDLTDRQLEASAALSAAICEYIERRWGFRVPLKKVAGADLVPGFHDHADGDGRSWNLNRHTDRLYRWTWERYLDAVRTHLYREAYVVSWGEKSTRPLSLRDAMSRLREVAKNLAVGGVVRVKKVLVR